MLKSIFILLFCLFSATLFSQKNISNKIVIDQNNAYSINIIEGKLALEIRVLDDVYNKFSIKYIPIKQIEENKNYSWDIKDGVLYMLSIDEISIEDEIHFIKKIKINDLISDINYQYTDEELYRFNNSIQNIPFKLLKSNNSLNSVSNASISVSDKIYISVKLKDKYIVYSDEFSDNWESIELNVPDYISIVFLTSHYFIADDMVYINMDCENCEQKKSILENKIPFMFLVDKNKKTIKKLEILNEDKGDIINTKYFESFSSELVFN